MTVPSSHSTCFPTPWFKVVQPAVNNTGGTEYSSAMDVAHLLSILLYEFAVPSYIGFSQVHKFYLFLPGMVHRATPFDRVWLGAMESLKIETRGRRLFGRSDITYLSEVFRGDSIAE